MNPKIYKVGLNLVAILVLGGCSLAPKYIQPTMNIPDSKEALGNVLTMEIKEKWWEDFGDVQLNAFVEEALANNYDLLVAMERIEQARSQWSYTRGSRFPSLNVQGEATRNRKNISHNGDYNNFSLSGILNFELDLWGRVRDSNRSALAKLLAVKANSDMVRLSLIANVMQNYFGILALNNQVEISQNTLKSRTENYEYRKKEFEAGKISEIDMQQAKSEMAGVSAQLYKILMEQNSAQSAFLVLLGRDGKNVFEDEISKTSKDLPRPPNIKAGLPSSILQKRPDIQAAEQNLKAANFSIGVARSAYFPTISLTGLFGYASPQLSEMIKNSNSTWNFGGNFIANLLDFGRTSANVKLSQSQYKEMLLTYGQTLRLAFSEVREGLFNYQNANERLNGLEEQVNALRRALTLARLRYAEGYTNYLEVLSTQGALFSAELEQESAKLESLSAAIALYKAFGGGWDKEEFEALQP